MCQQAGAKVRSAAAAVSCSRNLSLLSLVAPSECSRCSSVCGVMATGTTPCGQSSLPAIMGVVGGGKDSNGSYVGILDVFKLGVGPSSSHTMGPMLAAKQFVDLLDQRSLSAGVARITVDLYGSLALTGKGHATDRASVLGLAGFRPDSIDPEVSDVVYNNICTTNTMDINGGERRIHFSPTDDVIFHETVELPYHPNGMTITAFGATIDDNASISALDLGSIEGDVSLSVLLTETYYSIGGGFINTEAELVSALAESADGEAVVRTAENKSQPQSRRGSLLTPLPAQPYQPDVTTGTKRVDVDVSSHRWVPPTKSPPEDDGGTRLLSDSTSVGSLDFGSPSPRGKQGLESREIVDLDDCRSTAASSYFPATIAPPVGSMVMGPPVGETLSLPIHPPHIHPECVTFEGSSESAARIVAPDETPVSNIPVAVQPSTVPFPFNSAQELLIHATQNNITIAEIMMQNECASRGFTRAELNTRIDKLAATIDACVERGLRVEGRMPVSNIPRRAARMHRVLLRLRDLKTEDPMGASDWIALFARAVNEENACGGRVVTAPTNGAAGTLPAVLTYYRRFIKNASMEGVRVFLATAAAIGSLCKRNASISGAEAGCQAEVGSACAMAAAGLCAVLGGSPFHIENAAEIGLEHCLGMTCDPISGLVQIPCIERNCVASVKAVLASRMALMGDGEHEVSLDSCVETMYRTGLDMQAKYRETSTGGLAVFARKLAAPASPKAAESDAKLRSFDHALDF